MVFLGCILILSHQAEPLTLLMVITSDPPHLSQSTSVLFWPLGLVQTTRVSLDSPQNRTWGKGFHARENFIQKCDLGAGSGGRESTSFPTEALDIGFLGLYLPRGHINHCYSGTSAGGRKQEGSTCWPCPPLTNVWPHWVLTPLYVHAVHMPKQTHSILCFNSNREKSKGNSRPKTLLAKLT